MENLETTKRTAAEIEQKVKEAKVTEKNINEARESYRSAAARSSLLYFILNDLNKINPLYQFSLKVGGCLSVCLYVCFCQFFIENGIGCTREGRGGEQPLPPGHSMESE